MKLHTENFGGNLHQTANEINRLGWSDFIHLLHYSTGGGFGNTVAVFLMPDDMVVQIRRNKSSYAADPRHDFPKEKQNEK